MMPSATPASTSSTSATSIASAPPTRLDALGTMTRPLGGFAALGERFYTRLPPQSLPTPYLVAISPDALAQFGLKASDMSRPDTIARLAGGHANAAPDRRTPPSAAVSDDIPAYSSLPIATVYSGHQFGHWAGQLGDGRALMLGEMPDLQGRWQEVQLKGSGLTPYSRMGDGRAVLRSSIREFLCSEAMHALGVPTTRALAVVGSPLTVRRETVETTAIVTRYAPSLIRFGHFEHFWSINDYESLRALADHLIRTEYPEILTARGLDASVNVYLSLLTTVVERTADLMAQWQSLGFCHGVMNTDNMSMLGLTIDYGPFGFLDGFDARHICNHTDTQGRYAYHRQPEIGRWNLFALAQAMLPLIAAPHAGDDQPEADSDAANAAIALTKNALGGYGARFAAQYRARMSAKLGLTAAAHRDAASDAASDTNAHTLPPDDGTLIDRLLQLMDASRADFTLTFRLLSGVRRDAAGDRSPVRDQFRDLDGIDAWLVDYRARLRLETCSDDERAAAMNRVNPRFVLRNHLAELAIRAANDGDFGETRRLLDVLRHPYDEQPENAHYAALPPDWADSLEVSCSS